MRTQDTINRLHKKHDAGKIGRCLCKKPMIPKEVGFCQWRLECFDHNCIVGPLEESKKEAIRSWNELSNQHQPIKKKG